MLGTFILLMVGLIVKYLGREYKVTDTIISSLVLHREEFIFEGGGILHSFQKIRDDILYEVEVAEFDEVSKPLPKGVNQIDPEYSKMIEERDSDCELNQKLKLFFEIKAILKEEGLI